MVNGGGALELLVTGTAALFNKVGSLIQGQPTLADTITDADSIDADDILRLAASLDQVSPHVEASAIVTSATRRPWSWNCPKTSARNTATGGEH